MRILNDDGDVDLRAVTIYLTTEEARQLVDHLRGLLEDADVPGAHAHLWDQAHEIMLIVTDRQPDPSAT